MGGEREQEIQLPFSKAHRCLSEQPLDRSQNQPIGSSLKLAGFLIHDLFDKQMEEMLGGKMPHNSFGSQW